MRQAQGLLLACSGGLDSMCLLHALLQLAERPALRVLHVDHDLQAASSEWAEFVRRYCDQQGLPLIVEKVVVQQAGEGPEAAARQARYAAFQAYLEPREILVLAHHQDDQIETLLMRMLDGQGQNGGMQAVRTLGRGYLWRPLLGQSRALLRDYAQHHQLQWVEDPSNQDTRYRRNHLRHVVLPALEAQLPALRSSLLRFDSINQHLQRHAESIAMLDLNNCIIEQQALSIPALRSLSSARQMNLLRHWLEVRSGDRLPMLLQPLLAARRDAAPACRIGPWELRRYRDGLFRMSPLPAPPHTGLEWDMRSELRLPDGCGKLIPMGQTPERLTLRWQQGAEQIRLPGREHRSRIKNLWQAAGVPPWVRQRTPLLYRDGVLVAVADRWFDADFLQQHGKAPFRWSHGLIGDPQLPA